jgi:3-oxoacyl-[acyl-carrier-protein] synthase-1
MNVNVIGAGMVTALGLDWQTSCAASRAGVSRAERIEYFKVQAGDPWEMQHVNGHRATLLTSGFEGRGRFKRLLAGALADLVRQGLAPPTSCSMYLLLPRPPVKSLEPRWVDVDVQSRYSELDESQLRTAAEEHVMSAAALARWPGSIRVANISFSGESGFLQLLQQVDSNTGSGYAIVAVLDSLLEDSELVSLHRSGRLKTDANPVGLMPGEAAVVLLLGSGGECHAAFGPMASAPAEDSAESVKPPSGIRLAQLIENVGGQAGWPGDSTPWILSDHNGEAVRAQLWGSAWHRLCAKQPSFHKSEFWYAAASFGDSGDANPAVAAAMALAAWNRKYAPADECCIVTSAQDRERVAVIMKRTD